MTDLTRTRAFLDEWADLFGITPNQRTWAEVVLTERFRQAREETIAAIDAEDAREARSAHEQECGKCGQGNEAGCHARREAA